MSTLPDVGRSRPPIIFKRVDLPLPDVPTTATNSPSFTVRDTSFRARTVPVEFDIRGTVYHYDMKLSGWWKAANDTISVEVVSEAFVEENPDVFLNTYRKDHEMSGVTFSEVVLKDKRNVQEQLVAFVESIGRNAEDMSADNFVLATANRMSQGLIQPESVLFAAVFILMFVVCGYLLIYNIFDIPVMQDVRQYGLLRTIGASARQFRGIVNRQAIWLTMIGLPVGMILGYFAGWLLLPAVMEFFSLERHEEEMQVSISASPLIFVIAALFTILTVYISIRRPAKKAAGISPLEAVRYTEQKTGKKASVHRRRGGKLPYMAFSNLGRNKRRAAFIILSMLLCIVLFNSILVVTKSIDEEKFISRSTKTDFTVYNSIAFNVEKGFQFHSDGVPQPVIDMQGRLYGNVMGASENFWEDMVIFEGETDLQILKQKMLTGEYAIIGCFMDDLTGDPERTPLTDALQIGDSVSFSKDGKIVKTCTILAKASLVGTQRETPTTTTAQSNIGGDAPFVFLPDTAFREIYDTPTLLNFAFNVEESVQPHMEMALSSYVEENPSAAYTSTKLIKEQVDSIRSMILIVGSLIGGIMAFAGLINFINMIITNIITRRHEFATLQSIGMTERQLRRLVVYEGVYYATGAGLIGTLTAVFLALTVLKNMLNAPSMWFFSLRLTLVPAAVISVLYLILAAVIPMVALYFFHGGTVVERLRTTE